MSPSPLPTDARPEQYIFITPVWGEVYVERFVKVSLPSQLSPGNLGSVPSDRALYLIYTRKQDVRAIKRSQAYKRLKAMMPVSIRSLDDLPSPELQGNPHELQTAAYMRGIAAGAGKSAAFVFLTPDILMGEGSFGNMVKLTEQGKRVILVAGIRMTSDGAVSCVARHATANKGEAPIPCRSLVRACMDSPHPITSGHIVTREKVLAAQHFYWRVGDHGLLVRGFHVHPILVWPRDADAAIRNTLDDEYVSRACPDRMDWHTVTDSDEMCVIEFSDRNHKLGMLRPQPMTDRDIVHFIAEGTTPDHRIHVLERIRFHTKGISAAEWEPIESQSDTFLRKYLDLFERGFGEPDAPELPHLGSSLHERLEAMFGRRPNGTPHGEISIPRLLMLGLAAPFWVVYRIVNYKLYRYLDRLNAEVIEIRTVLLQTRHQLHEAIGQMRQMEKVLERSEREKVLLKLKAIESKRGEEGNAANKLRKAI